MAKNISFTDFLERQAYHWAEKKSEYFYPDGLPRINLCNQDRINLLSTNCIISLFEKSEEAILYIVWPEERKLALWSVDNYVEFKKWHPRLAERLLKRGLENFQKETRSLK